MRSPRSGAEIWLSSISTSPPRSGESTVLNTWRFDRIADHQARPVDDRREPTDYRYRLRLIASLPGGFNSGCRTLRTPGGNWAEIKAGWRLRRRSGWVISVEYVLSGITLPKHDEPVGVADPHVPHHRVSAVITGLRQRLAGAPVTRAVWVAWVGWRVGWAPGLTKRQGAAGVSLGSTRTRYRRNKPPQQHSRCEAGDQSLHDLGLFLDQARVSTGRFAGW
jgi:hypothetical protein